jgi:hypothetical protein
MIIQTLRCALLASVAFSAALPASGHDTDPARGQELFRPGLGHAAGLADHQPANAPPLYTGLGDAIGMTVTTQSAEAQSYFDQGLRLVWGFNHAEARRFFAHARTLDPGCAMCWWGEAFALGPNINDGMDDADVRPLTGDWPYLWLDATYLKVRQCGRIISWHQDDVDGHIRGRRRP